jgi:hypothetical protein
MSKPWLKFYPRDWRGDQALRHVSLPARGLWIDMICIMYEAKPYGHLLIGDQPLDEADLSRAVGSSVEEVRALLVELLAAKVCRRTRTGVLYSKRMLEDHKRSVNGQKAKLAALAEAAEKKQENSPPSREPPRGASTQKAEARVKVEGAYSPSTLYDQKNDFLGPKEIRDAFLAVRDEGWVVSYVDRCGWRDLPTSALIAPNSIAMGEVETALRQLRRKNISIVEGISVVQLERAA